MRCCCDVSVSVLIRRTGSECVHFTDFCSPRLLHIHRELRDTNIHHRHSEVFGATETIEGLDAVGQVVELGPGVTDFHVGQVVLTIGRGIGARKLTTFPQKYLAVVLLFNH